MVYHKLTDQQNLKLHRLLNACVRYVFGNIPWTANVTPYRIALGWLSVCRRREYFIASLAHRVTKYRTPSFLAEHLIPVSTLPDIRRSARSGGGYFYEPLVRTDTLRYSFPQCAARVINSLGRLDLENLSAESFKTLLRNTLFDRDRLDWLERSHREGLITIPPNLDSSLILPNSLRPQL